MRKTTTRNTRRTVTQRRPPVGAPVRPSRQEVINLLKDARYISKIGYPYFGVPEAITQAIKYLQGLK
jgi:hypothetical protein